MHHRRHAGTQALDLIRKPVHGRKNVGNTANQRLEASARASLTPLIDRLPPVSTPADWLTRTIFPADTDTELYTESHTESYMESTDMGHTGTEPWLDNSTVAWLDADICEALIERQMRSLDRSYVYTEVLINLLRMQSLDLERRLRMQIRTIRAFDRADFLP